ncbi:MAG: undecaprenyl/decaprenyl-phosphate alpha-N-acetylglucosaminyl 1-phosphate transferase [Candidatus Eisenbacteria sp.]|nr:undecaprenyl/decaprenyl-phosphate alpha-N-acetylglucosaminyl 1-phosphate transferase [Candidatus Eisenbacteria bacterium]
MVLGMDYLVAFSVAFFVVLLTTPLVRFLARKTGFVDVPSQRKAHRRPTPLLGGLSVLVGFLGAMAMGMYLLREPITPRLLGFLGGGLLVFLIGLVDDRVGLSPTTKLCGQLAAGLLLLFAGNTNGLITNGWMDISLSLLWVVGLINAFNFLDNMDGISSGITFIASCAFLVICVFHGQMMTAVLAAAAAGASLAFLRFNFNPASIFLGDAGAMFMGYVMASVGLMSTWHQSSHLFMLVPVLILGYPIFDISLVTMTRWLDGRGICEPGKDHSSHRLASLIASPRGSVWIIYGLCAGLALCGVLLCCRLTLTSALIIGPAVALGLFWLGRLLSGVPVQRS